MSEMSHESSYESLSGFTPKFRTRVGFSVRLGLGLGLRLGSPVFFFLLRLNILTHDSLTHFKKLQSRIITIKTNIDVDNIEYITAHILAAISLNSQQNQHQY